MHHYKYVTDHLRKRWAGQVDERGALGANLSLNWIRLRSGLSQRLVISSNIFQNSLGFPGEMALMVPFVYVQRAPACPEGHIVPVGGGGGVPPGALYTFPQDLSLAGQKLPLGPNLTHRGGRRQLWH